MSTFDIWKEDLAMKDLFFSVLGFNTGLYVFILFCPFNSKLIPTSKTLLYFFDTGPPYKNCYFILGFDGDWIMILIQFWGRGRLWKFALPTIQQNLLPPSSYNHKMKVAETTALLATQRSSTLLPKHDQYHYLKPVWHFSFGHWDSGSKTCWIVLTISTNERTR